MKRTIIAFAVSLAFLAGAAAQERLNLSTPIPAPPAITGYTISRLLLTWEPTAQIVVTLRATDGTLSDQVYEGATATAILVALNKANLSTRSLNQRIFDRLIADGKIAGTVTGSVP